MGSREEPWAHDYFLGFIQLWKGHFYYSYSSKLTKIIMERDDGDGT
jgi:hypothetical protein